MIIYLISLFTTFELLSIIFNPFFHNYFLWTFEFNINVSVIFFCLCFFIIDLVTEIYGEKAANKIIYAKIISQFLFTVLGYFAIKIAYLENTQLEMIINQTPLMMFNGFIASIIGYKLTIKIMQKLKVTYNGNFLALRYLASSVPGEIVFSLVYSFLMFSQGKTFAQYLSIFLSLSLLKILCSAFFSLLAVPLTMFIRYSINLQKEEKLSFN